MWCGRSRCLWGWWTTRSVPSTTPGPGCASSGASSAGREAAFLEQGEGRERPDPHVDLAHDRRLGHRAPVAAVTGLGSVVPHDIDVTLGDHVGMTERVGLEGRAR